MRLGYGSEFHLLRWMGRHRSEFNCRVGEALGKKSESIRWLDFQTVENPKADNLGYHEHDQEWLGLDMLANNKELQDQWSDFWPTGAGIQNWDAVGWADHELLLVEAKAHIEEIKSDCGAESPSSIKKIEKAFREVQQALGVQQCDDWTKQYYQFTNRLATLYFLQEHDVPAHLIFIYFLGDEPTAGRKDCPKTPREWHAALEAQDKHVGLPVEHSLKTRIHKLFLPVSVVSVKGHR